MLKKIIKTLFLVFLAAITAVIVYLYAESKEWPWWSSVVIFSGIIAVFMTIIFLKNYFIRKKEKKFVQRIIDQDNIDISLRSKGKKELKDIQRKWIESVTLLKKSNLRNKGNPLYIIPWYIVLGESGSGKTTCIKNSNLSLPMTEISKSAGISGTRDFDWWFFNEAVVLDTAGRYSIPIDEENDVKEWKNFLTLVCKYRKKEPLNGIVITVAADDLLNKSSGDLNQTGQGLRKRIDQIMRSLGSKIPVYLMVTKTDLIHGMNDFASSLPDLFLEQAMGYSKTDENLSFESFLKIGFYKILERLKNIRLLIVQKDNALPSGALIFPDEFSKIFNGLLAFSTGVFESNPYQEDPMLRGIYFSSGIQSGVAKSDFIKDFSIIGDNISPTLSKNKKSIFITDFFKNILPKDRHIFYPIKEFLKWRVLTIRLGFASWILIWLFFYGLISFSFWNNSKNLSFIINNISPINSDQNEPSPLLINLNNLRSGINTVEAQNRNIIFPKCGYYQSQISEELIKENYVKSFRDYLLKKLDLDLENKIKNFNSKTDNKTAINYADHLIGRIEILRQFKDNNFFKNFNDENRVSQIELSSVYPEIDEELTNIFIASYNDFIKWNENKSYLAQKEKQLQNLLKELIHKKSDNIQWITDMDIKTGSNYYLSSFWVDYNSSYLDHINVPKGFTLKGKKEIDAFLLRLKKSLGNDEFIIEKEKDFNQWYETKYLRTWAEFSGNIDKGIGIINTYEVFKDLAKGMTTSQNPYFDLIFKIDEETDFIKNKPAWLIAINTFVKASKIEPEKDDKNSLINSLKKKSNKVVVKLDPKSIEKRKIINSISEKYHNYLGSLEKLRNVSHSQKDAYQAAAALFSTDLKKENKDSLFFAANDTFFLLNREINNDFDGSVIENLLKGPLKYLTLFSTNEASCIIQKKWAEMVVGPASGAASYKIPHIVFNKNDGLLWTFLDGPLKPFVSRDKNGFYANISFNNQIYFKDEFFNYITKGAESAVNIEPSYSVVFKTLPLDVNKEAKNKPYKSVLKLDCADKKYQLENYNYPITKEFKWSLDTCGDVSLTIMFKEYEIKKVYQGSLGFAKFLKDFKDGVKIFNPDDFPANKDVLEAENISEIIVSYDIKNSKDVVKILEKTPVKMPDTITECWSNE